MKKRITMAVVAGGLLAAMLPIIATAQGGSTASALELDYVWDGRLAGGSALEPDFVWDGRLAGSSVLEPDYVWDGRLAGSSVLELASTN